MSHADNQNGSKQGWLSNVPDPHNTGAPFLPEPEDLETFSNLFTAVTDPEANGSFTSSVQALRDFMAAAVGRYSGESAASLALSFLEAASIPLSEDHNHIWQAFQNLAFAQEQAQEEDEILEGYDTLTTSSICQAGRFFMDANKRCPTPEDGLILQGDLANGVRTWADIHSFIMPKWSDADFSFSKPKSLGEFFCKHGVFVYQKTFLGTLTHEDIIASARAEKIATGRRPAGDDNSPIAYGPLAATGLSWRSVRDALRVGLHGLPRGGSLSKTLNEAGIPKGRRPMARLSPSTDLSPEAG